jgi:hypothetical protein
VVCDGGGGGCLEKVAELLNFGGGEVVGWWVGLLWWRCVRWW